MALSTDCSGLGMPPLLAQLVGFSTAFSITAAGSSIANGTQMDAQNDFFLMTATGADGIILNSNFPLMVPIIVVNTSASTGNVYPPNSSGTLNGNTGGTALAVGAHKMAIFLRYSTNGWASNLSA